MRMRANFHLVSILVFIIVFAFHGCCFAVAKPREVRVGFYFVDGLQMRDSEGNFAGYTQEYLEAVAQYTGWKYKYIVGSFSELEQKLAAGEIDLLSSIVKTPEREKLFDFPAQQQGMGGTRLIVSAKNKTIAYEDFPSFNGMKIGDIAGINNEKSIRQVNFERYQKKNGFHAEIVKFDTPAAMLNALEDGRIDGALVSATRSLKRFRVIAHLQVMPLYFAVKKGDRELVDGLDFAMTRIRIYEPDFDQKLALRYFSSEEIPPPVFSKSELEYIKSHKIIRAIYDPNRRPLEYKDPESKEYAGIMRGVFDVVSAVSGIQFEFIPIESAEGVDNLHLKYNAPIRTLVNHDFNWMQSKGAALSQIILSAPVVMVTAPQGRAISDMVALPEGLYLSIRYSQSHPEVPVTWRPSMKECFDAVRQGNAKFTIADFYSAEYFLQQNRYRDLDFRNMGGTSTYLSIAVAKTADPILLSIMNKSLESITHDTLAGIITKNTLYKQPFSLSALIYGHPIQSVSFFVGLLLLSGIFLAKSVADKNRLKASLDHTEKQGEVIRLMTESMNAGLLVREAELPFKLKYVNDNFYKLLGYTKEEFSKLAKDSLDSLFTKEDPDELRRLVAESLKVSDEYQLQFRLRRKDGSSIWVQDTGRKFLDTDGSIVINSVITDITPLKVAMEELRVRAEVDSVTPVNNRHTFYIRTRKMLDANPDRQYVIVCWDIARFKVFNDLYGIEGGNRLLYAIGSHIREGMAGRGECARLYADNFVLCFPIELLDAERMAQEIIDDLNRFPFDFEFVPNIGIYVIDDNSVPVELMCDRASIAQQSVKGNYEKVFAFYNDRLRNRLLKEQQIINDMKPALEGGQFELWLQPQFNIATGSVTGAEALVRWRHPQKGLIMPGDFIPIFEKNGFITRLDLYMFESACRLLRKWKDEGRPLTPISVNLSRIDLYNSLLCDQLCGLVRQYGLTESLLKLEITESAYMSDPEQLVSAIQQLSSRGFKIEMDDFGSGYSSLNALKEMHVDLLKLDMRFISTKGDTERGGSILNSMVRMTKWLNLPVLAEGVETWEQAEYLKSIGCLLAQGYLYSRPVTAEGFESQFLTNTEEPTACVSAHHGMSNQFWDPQAQSTLIFNSIIDAAALFEYHDGQLEAIQTNEKFFCIEDGLTREEFSSYARDIMPLLFEADRAGFKAALEAAAAGESETETISRWRATSGAGFLWLRIRLRQIANSQGSHILFAAIENVTQTKRLEASIYESKETMRIAMEQSSLFVWEYYPKTRKAVVIRHNSNIPAPPVSMENYPESWLESGLVHPDDKAALLEAFKKIDEGATEASCIVRILYDDGLYHFERVSLTAIYDRDGLFIKIVGTAASQTKRPEELN